MRERYRDGLGVDELLRVVAGLLRGQRRTDALICRYLADLADGLGQWPALALFYGDVHQLARYKLGLSLRSSRERVRVGRALRRLPILCRALMDGELAYSRVREVTRVARSDNEREWLQAARDLSMRQLEQRVAAAYGPVQGVRSRRRPPSNPASHQPPSSAPSGAIGEVIQLFPDVAAAGGPRSMQLPQRLWDLLLRAVRAARQRSPEPLTDTQAMECVLRAALAYQARDSHPPSPHACHEGDRPSEDPGIGGIDSVRGIATQSGQTGESTQAPMEQCSPVQAGRESHTAPSSQHTRSVPPGERCQAQVVQGPPSSAQNLELSSTTQGGAARGGAARSHSTAMASEASTTQSGPSPEDNPEPSSVRQGGAARGGADDLQLAAMATERSTTQSKPPPADNPELSSRCLGAPSSEDDGLKARACEALGGKSRQVSVSPCARAEDGPEPLSEDAKQLLDLIQGDKLWNVATLSDETGMPLHRLTVALTDLEVARRVCRDPVGFYEIIGGGRR